MILIMIRLLVVESSRRTNYSHSGHHIYSVLVENRFGVLTEIAGLFARRGFNIYSLAVSPTEDETFSWMTIVVEADRTPLEQVESNSTS